MSDLDAVTAALQSTRVSPTGVSFAGKSLKLDTTDDAIPVVEAIEACKELQFLNMEGNTLGVEAAKAIAKALEKHPEFKRALWKDMFTGRMKTEIPKALEHLGEGLVTATAKLAELDLSDNAFGPIGVQGLASLLRSSTCYGLEELRLNNNGLGIGGGKLLASALSDCYDCSKKQGKPIALKVFIAGRNRLENDGAKALAEVFKKIGTLEEIAMPQNGIYHVGISALSEAFSKNPNLQIINLNDNTIGGKGAAAIAKILPQLTKLRQINFGDCLLKTKGAIHLAEGFKDNTSLEEVILGYNEIKCKGGLELIKAMANKTKLKSIILNGNQFGEKGIEELKKQLQNNGQYNALGSLSEDEYDEEEEEGEDEEEQEESEEEHSENDDDKSEVEEELVEIKTPISNITVQDFLTMPNVENLMALGDNKADLLLKEASKFPDEYLENFIPVLMKVAALSTNSKQSVVDSSLACCELLFRELFTWAQKSEKISILNNMLLVNLGLIKSEDKFKPQWNLQGCLNALESVLKKNYVPETTKDTLKVFMKREVENNGEFLNIKKKLLESLQ